MASGIIVGSTYGVFTSQIVWSSTSNGVSANSSNVTASLQIRRTNSYTTTGTVPYNLNINGNNYSGSWYGSFSNNWVEIASRTIVVGHNQDGSKVCNINSNATGPSGTSLSGNTTTANADVTLDKIDRYAMITSAPNFNDEENPVLGYSNPVGNNVTTLQASITDETGNTVFADYRDIPKSGTSYKFELTSSERNALRNATPNSNTMTVRFYVKTVMSGQTFYQYKNATLSIINANPVFNDFTFEDVNATTLALTGDSSININGYSNIKATISTNNKAVAQKGATMSKYRVIIDNQTYDIPYSSSESVDGTIINSTSGTYQVYAIDSRNNSTLVTKLASRVIDYTPITLDTSSKVERNNGGVGGNAVLSYSGSFWNDSFGQLSNSITSASYQFKKTSENAWVTGTTNITPTLSNNTFSFNDLVRSNNPDYTFDLQSSYDFKISISDKLSTKEIQLTPMASSVPNISFADDGVGIMCDYDESLGGLLQVGGEIVGQYTDTYSTSETKTNKIWIDNKPIYRKVFKITNPALSSVTTVNINQSNIDTIFVKDMQVLKTDQKLMRPINITYNTSTITSQTSNTEIKYRIPIDVWNWASIPSLYILYITIEYTKTTD